MMLLVWKAAAGTVDVAFSVARVLWNVFTCTPVGKAVESSYVFQYLWGMMWTTCAVFFQKLSMHHLGPIDTVGERTEGMTAIVTGPTSGIGRETAAALARRGARVILACRNIAKGNSLKAELEAETTAAGLPRPNIEVKELDLSSIMSVKRFCKDWEALGRELNILINNAGIYSMGAPRMETCDGFESHMGSNHLGHFLLTLGLMPALKRGAASKPGFGARVVHVSSSVHMMAVGGIRMSDPHMKQRYSPEQAYGSSKLAQIMFTRELRRRLGQGSAVQVFAVHPGMVLTEVVRTLPRAMQVGHRVIMGVILLPPAEGARASIYCATAKTAPAEAPATGGYFNANCRPLEPSRAAQDNTAALWLWRWSAQQVGLPPAWDLPEL